VERTVGVIHQRLQELRDLEERAWPTVVEDEHFGIRVRGPSVHEVRAHAVHSGCEHAHAVQLRLCCAPIELVPPVGHRLLHELKLGAILPPGRQIAQLIGKSRAAEKGNAVGVSEAGAQNG
jgi:hypothetical protein